MNEASRRSNSAFLRALKESASGDGPSARAKARTLRRFGVQGVTAPVFGSKGVVFASVVAIAVACSGRWFSPITPEARPGSTMSALEPNLSCSAGIEAPPFSCGEEARSRDGLPRVADTGSSSGSGSSRGSSGS